MATLSICLVVVSAVLALGQCGCFREDWRSTIAKEGMSVCSNQRLIKGFYRSSRQRDDSLTLLEGAECCDMTPPWTYSSTHTVTSDWMHTLDSNYKWAYCPAGYFLNGLYRSGNDQGGLYNIEEGRCTKPGDHPTYSSHCYALDISLCFNDRNFCGCREGYYVTGIYRGSCHSLNCLDQLRCCQLAPGPEPLGQLFEVKTRIMETTVSKLALLAHYLGYANCHGCRSSYVGDDFYRYGDSWKADQSRRCSANKGKYRLSLLYGDWKLEVKNIQFGDPITEELLPETLDSGTISNRGNTEATKTVSRSDTSVVSITHTKTSSWTSTVEFNFEIPYILASASFRFSYENSVTTEDSTGKEHSKTFEINTSKTLAANSSASWRFKIFKSRKTIPYTATIIVRFSAELQGFLRRCGSYNGDCSNFHIDHRGSDAEPIVNYRFGGTTSPFYTELKLQSDRNHLPWMWDDMKNRYRNVQDLINDLSNETNYVFTLSGQLEIIEGKHVEFYWEENKPVTRRSADHEYQEDDGDGVVKYLKQVARTGPDDVPAPRPPPPEVKIEVRRKPVSFPIDVENDGTLI